MDIKPDDLALSNAPVTTRRDATPTSHNKLELATLRPFPTVAEYFDAHPEAYDLDTVMFKMDDILYSLDKRRATSLPALRMETFDMASYWSLAPADFDELLHPTIVTGAISIMNEETAKGKLTMDLLARGVNPIELIFQDYLASLHLHSTATLIGRYQGGDQAIMQRSPEERDQIAPFYTELTQHTPRFADSFERIATVIEERLPATENYGVLFEDIDRELTNLLQQPRSTQR